MTGKRLAALVDVYRGFERDGGVRLGAAVAYYSLFAFAPLLVLAVAGAQRLLGREQVVEQLRKAIEGMIGAESAQLLIDVLVASMAGKTSTTFGIVGLALLAGAVGVAYMQLHDSFNDMWHVRERPDTPLLERVKITAPRLALVLLPASMLIVITLASSVLVWAAERFRLGNVDDLLTTLGSPVAITLAAWVSLVVLYRFVPDARIRFADVMLPAAAVALAWAFGTYLYGAYLSYAGTRSVSGAAGAVFLLLVWMNYTSRAILFGCWWGRWRAEKEREVESLPHAERVLILPSRSVPVETER